MSGLAVDGYSIERKLERREGASFATVERLLALYPGESKELLLRIHGSRGHLVAVEEWGFPYSVASLEIAPKQARAPYQARMIVAASVNATPGVYTWGIRIIDVTRSAVLGEEPITMVIVPKHMSKKVAEHVTRLRKVYENYGIQVALWSALRVLYPRGASFSDIKSLYELVTSRSVSKGTVGNMLKTMVAKKLLEKRGGLYIAVDMNRDVLFSRVDLARVRFPWQVLRRKEASVEDIKHIGWGKQQIDLCQLPQPIQKAYMHAERLAEEHNPLTALYFLLCSLLGVRQTGHLLSWLNGWFIVLEPKTGFAHHFYSWLLHWMLLRLDLQEGIYYRPQDPMHHEAREIAQQYIRKIYGSHQSARRLHYMLWERGYVWSKEDEVYTVRIYHYFNGEVGIQILDKAGREELYSENLKSEPAWVETYTTLPCRHINERSEEAYHYRPGGLY